MMKNIIAKPKRSLAHRDMVVESWLMVLLKLMNLKSCKRQKDRSSHAIAVLIKDRRIWTDEWVCTANRTLFSLTNEVLIHVVTWMSPENIMWSKSKITCFFSNLANSIFSLKKYFGCPPCTSHYSWSWEYSNEQNKAPALILVTLTWWLKYSKCRFNCNY